MYIVQAHNFYKIRGGEETVIDNEFELLVKRQNRVERYEERSEEIKSAWTKIRVFFSAPFSLPTLMKFSVFLAKEKPDVVHVHNYFPRLSPSIFFSCKRNRIPVVHTLHNFRPVCPTSLLMWNGKVYEESLYHGPWWALRKRAYRNSFWGTLSLCTMIALNKRLRTWQRKVDRYIALTEFSKELYVKAGWPAERISVKPNFIEDPHQGLKNVEKCGSYALFVGRLSSEKGVELLLKAWASLNIPLKVVGDGPLARLFSTSGNEYVEFLGVLEKEKIMSLMKDASFLVMASTCYEGFPMVLVEAFANGTPAVVPNSGGTAEIVTDGVSGLHFKIGSSQDLAVKVKWMVDNDVQARKMGYNARQEYLEKYTAEKNYKKLVSIYRQAIREAGKF